MSFQPSPQKVADVYQGNPAPLQQKVQQAGQQPNGLPNDLIDALALQMVMQQQQVAKNQLAMQQAKPQGTIVDQMRQQAIGDAKEILAPRLEGIKAAVHQRLASAGQGQPQQPQGQGIDTLPSNIGMAAGGIVAFSGKEDSDVKNPDESQFATDVKGYTDAYGKYVQDKTAQENRDAAIARARDEQREMEARQLKDAANQLTSDYLFAPKTKLRESEYVQKRLRESRNYGNEGLRGAVPTESLTPPGYGEKDPITVEQFRSMTDPKDYNRAVDARKDLSAEEKQQMKDYYANAYAMAQKSMQTVPRPNAKRAGDVRTPVTGSDDRPRGQGPGPYMVGIPTWIAEFEDGATWKGTNPLSSDMMEKVQSAAAAGNPGARNFLNAYAASQAGQGKGTGSQGIATPGAAGDYTTSPFMQKMQDAALTDATRDPNADRDAQAKWMRETLGMDPILAEQRKRAEAMNALRHKGDALRDPLTEYLNGVLGRDRTRGGWAFAGAAGSQGIDAARKQWAGEDVANEQAYQTALNAIDTERLKGNTEIGKMGIEGLKLGTDLRKTGLTAGSGIANVLEQAASRKEAAMYTADQRLAGIQAKLAEAQAKLDNAGTAKERVAAIQALVTSFDEKAKMLAKRLDNVALEDSERAALLEEYNRNSAQLQVYQNALSETLGIKLPAAPAPSAASPDLSKWGKPKVKQ